MAGRYVEINGKKYIDLSSNKPALFGLGVLCVGLAVGIVWWEFHFQNYLQKDGVRTTGSPDFAERGDSFSKNLWISFEANGQSRREQVSIPIGTGAGYIMGNRVPIIYDPKNPAMVQLDTPTAFMIQKAKSLLFGVIAFAVGSLFFLGFFRKKQPQAGDVLSPPPANLNV